jgi:dynein heavy chain 2
VAIQIRKNLHIVVSMDPSNETFRARTESNPALFTRCAILWVGKWTKDALDKFASMKMRDAVRCVLLLVRLDGNGSRH